VYIVIVILTMFLLPVGSVLLEHSFKPDAPIIFLVGRWFVFWGVGVRLLLAGLRQAIQPRFTAAEIFHMKGEEASPLVRELGLANIATGSVGLLSLVHASFVLPVSILAGIFYGLAGVLHLWQRNRSRNENVAMTSDLSLFLVLAVFVTGSWIARAH
jgi:uncharacterized protein involved in response to NO